LAADTIKGILRSLNEFSKANNIKRKKEKPREKKLTNKKKIKNQIKAKINEYLKFGIDYSIVPSKRYYDNDSRVRSNKHHRRRHPVAKLYFGMFYFIFK